MESIMNHISIVLVRTTHPGNIGATARAMKTMGLMSLRLVAPKIFPAAEVTARAAGADDILDTASVYNSLREAVSDCALVYGTSARMRSISWPCVTPEEAAGQIIQSASDSRRSALVFGRESSGLSNRELELCNRMILIPANPDFSSLNLAAAVQILCYEIRKHAAGEVLSATDRLPAVTMEDMDRFYAQLEQCLVEIGFLDPDKPRRLMRRLKSLFSRLEPDQNEYNILRGILAAVRTRVGGKDS
jgi:tRNA (cytidine32/uridine32-2'-O)-methyltransferase